ncbi:hypothetical protein GGG16DRAFT_118300 [Schizophyllum commune]
MARPALDGPSPASPGRLPLATASAPRPRHCDAPPPRYCVAPAPATASPGRLPLATASPPPSLMRRYPPPSLMRRYPPPPATHHRRRRAPDVLLLTFRGGDGAILDGVILER